MTNKTDQYYINQILKGDVNAYSYLVNTYQNMVFTFALKMVKNREEAEEISQEAFVKAYKNLKSFEGKSKFSTWLYKIVYHAGLDYLKKNQKYYHTEEINEVTHNQLVALDNVFETIERNERTQIVDDCLLQLPEDERSIIWMFYYKELNLNEIMQVTSLSKSNVKVKLHRARKHLLAIVKNTVEPEIISSYGKK